MNNEIIIVPEWKVYYPNLAMATQEQREFYIFWEGEFEKGNFVEVDGNIAYIFLYLYKIIPPCVEKFLETKNIENFYARFNRIRENCSKYKKVMEYLDQIIVDAYIYTSEYDKAWELSKKLNNSLQVSDFLNFKFKCKDISIDGEDLFRLVRSASGITKFGEENKSEIIKLSNIFLDNFFKEHGINFIEFFMKKFDFENISKDDFLILKEFYPNEEKFNFWKKDYKAEKKRYPWIYAHNLFCGYAKKQIYVKCESVPSIISVAIENEVRRILRESENILRKKSNLPLVGEGWINETALFYKIVELFPNINIIQHGRPHWLAPQHIDIYFPAANLGIEYQGAQHIRPVDFFGGEEAFKIQQRRDLKKVDLCKKNNCRLIHVFENYKIEDLKNEISLIIETKSSNTNASIFGNNISKESSIELTQGDNMSNIWQKNNSFYLKKDGILKIPKAYKITKDYFSKAVRNIEKERVDVKNNIHSLEKKLFIKDKVFLKFIFKKAEERSILLGEITNQFNQLNILWVISGGRNENNVNLEDVKLHCINIIKGIQKMSKEWKKCYLTETSKNSSKLREITCEFYEVFFQEILKFTESIERIILFAESVSKPKNNINIDLEIKFNFSDIEKQYLGEIYRLEKLNNWRRNGWLGLTIYFIIQIWEKYN